MKLYKCMAHYFSAYIISAILFYICSLNSVFHSFSHLSNPSVKSLAPLGISVQHLLVPDCPCSWDIIPRFPKEGLMFGYTAWAAINLAFRKDADSGLDVAECCCRYLLSQTTFGKLDGSAKGTNNSGSAQRDPPEWAAQTMIRDQETLQLQQTSDPPAEHAIKLKNALIPDIA